MNKELLEKFIKSNISLEEIPKVFNDRALRDAEYPYIVLNSSKGNTTNYPRVDIELEIDIWDKQSNFSSVNKIADVIQNALDRQSFTDDHIVGTYYLNTRNNMDDEDMTFDVLSSSSMLFLDKTLKRNHMTFDVEIYFKEE